MASRLSRLVTHRCAVLFAFAVLLVCLSAPQLWAWSKFRSAQAALTRYHPAEARAALHSCQQVWGDRVSVRLLAARAARQDGDLDAAVAHLRAAQTLAGTATDETAFEWALIHACAGRVREVEEYLQRRADQSPREAGPLVWEALVVGYLRVSRTLDAMACVNYWLGLQPDNVRALELRGQTYVAGRGVVRGAEDYRRVLQIDPGRKATRWHLIDALVALGGYEEAAEHLEVFTRETPGDPMVASRLARCYNMLGRPADARRLVNEALANYPDDQACLRTRGQLLLTATAPAVPNPVAAEADLRRAVALAPNDFQAHNLLFQAILAQGRVEEAKAQLGVAEEVRDRVARITELSSRKLAEFPLEPALHSEMGRLLIEAGKGEDGERWLLMALDLDPNHKPAHAALAAYYERKGDAARAELHRKRAEE